MRLGWIDYSEEDRKNVADALSSLDEKRTVDELGIGLVRDAFSNIFFPGTSTVQTRAKYFLIVPYLLREAALWRDTRNADAAMEKINSEERKCARILLIEPKTRKGVIGERNLPQKWVARAPSGIYWNGIRQLKIFTRPNLSIRDYISLAIENRDSRGVTNFGNSRDDADESDRDDLNAGGSADSPLWNLPRRAFGGWREGLAIELLPDEAAFLRARIESEFPGTLFCYLLKNNIRVSEYKNIDAFHEALKRRLPDSIETVLDMAVRFSKFIQPAFAQYNIMASEETNDEAHKLWQDEKRKMHIYAAFDLDSLFKCTGLTDGGLRIFLELLRNAYAAGDIDKLRDVIKRREIGLKGFARAKTAHPGACYKDQWLGLRLLDYRLGIAGRIIEDIMQGERAGA